MKNLLSYFAKASVLSYGPPCNDTFSVYRILAFIKPYPGHLFLYMKLAGIIESLVAPFSGKVN